MKKFFCLCFCFLIFLKADEIYLNLSWEDYITLKNMEKKYSVNADWVDIEKILIKGHKDGIVGIMKEFYDLKNNRDILYINKEINYITKQSGLPDWVLKIIVQIESGYANNILALRGDKDMYKSLVMLEKIVPVLIKFYKPNRIVITGNKNALINIAQELFQKKYSFDIGVAQVNSINFKLSEIPSMLNSRYNLIKANNVLADCSNFYNISFKDTLECYNKGFKEQKQYSYFNKFVNAYIEKYTEDLRK